jgi:hypothetical protein
VDAWFSRPEVVRGSGCFGRRSWRRAPGWCRCSGLLEYDGCRGAAPGCLIVLVVVACVKGAFGVRWRGSSTLDPRHHDQGRTQLSRSSSPEWSHVLRRTRERTVDSWGSGGVVSGIVVSAGGSFDGWPVTTRQR